MIVSHNVWPCSAYACEDGIKHLIGKSNSITFNKDKFIKSSYHTGLEYIGSFKTRDDALKFSLSRGYDFKEYCLDYFRSGRAITENGFCVIEKTYSGKFDLFLTVPIISGIRSSHLDEKSLLIESCVDFECFLCGSKEDENIIVFELSESYRAECLCDKCKNKIISDRNLNSNYINKDEVLIKILKEKT